MLDKIAVVTGGSRGIGKEIVKTFAKAGATVIFNYSGSVEKANETVEEIVNEGGKVEAVKCNVADANDCKGMFDEILKKYGRIDILVNNAGITKDGLLLRMSEEDFTKVIDINLTGAFHCMKQVCRPMLRQKYGRIINISSVSGIMGNAGQVNYAASKAGLIGMTKSAARELAAKGVTVNAVAPGFVDTDMTKELADNVKTQASTQIPVGHFGKVEDIANAVAFLASEQASYITGQVLAVDGGMSM